MEQMHVLKRTGEAEEVSFDKILKRVKTVGQDPLLGPPLTGVNYSHLVMKVIDQLYDQIPTRVIDELTAEQCASMSTKQLDYATLANRIIVSNHHKNTIGCFSCVVNLLYNHTDPITGFPKPLVADSLWRLVMGPRMAELDALVDYQRDYLFDYFGFKTLEKAYLLKINNNVVERPQHMWLRVALGIHQGDFERVKETYNLLSQKYFTHATPTLFNAGTLKPQLSSCFLVAMEADSLDGIYNTLHDCANISKWAGGVGLHVHNVRATGTTINGTNGQSTGLVPMARVFNATARYINQGGKRNGSFAVYLEPWHADVEEFLDLKRNHGDEESRARDLFYALWIPDLFMQKVKDDADWALMCPHECPGLSDSYGAYFEQLYNGFVAAGRHKRLIKARHLWLKILDSQMETGTPYLLYKDAANSKSNQQNLGVIKSSNLCTEIIEYSNAEETAVCNLASIALNKFVDPVTKTFDYAALQHVTQVVTRNLNRIIDINSYPTRKAQRSNERHRPIGLGVQGLADVFALMDVPFFSLKAREINKNIFETLYYGALVESHALAVERRDDPATVYLPEELAQLPVHQRGAYSSFVGSPTARGQLQFDLWPPLAVPAAGAERHDWPALKAAIMRDGLRNSLLVAPMPTATTSQILGNNECFEPFTSNIYTRRTSAGEFVMVNRHLMAELSALGLWTDELKDSIILNKGSVQHLQGLSVHLKEKYKIVWEMPMKHLIDMAVDRARYVCQSQSLNLWVEDPDYKTLTSMHFYAWQAGLKTGMYYLRRKAKHQPQQFTIKPNASTSAMPPPQVGPTTEQTTTATATAACDMCSG